MVKRIIYLTCYVLFLAACNNPKIDYPETNKVDTTDNYFGVKVDDPFRWLENENAPETKSWIKAQNEVTYNYLNQIPFRENIHKRMKELVNHERIIYPVEVAGYYYYLKNEGLQEHEILYRQDIKSGEEEKLIDPNQLSDNKTVALAHFKVSQNGKYLAYSLATSGSDWRTILVYDLQQGKNLPDTIKNVKFSDMEWYKNGFYYTRFNVTDNNRKFTSVNNESAVYYHHLGTPQENDPLVFAGDKKSGRFYDIDIVGENNQYLVIYEAETTSGNQLYIKNIEQNDKMVLKLVTGFDYEYYAVACIDDILYLRTNYKAPKFRLARINLGANAIGEWETEISERQAVLEQCTWVGNSFLCIYQSNVQNTLLQKYLGISKMDTVHLPKNGSVDYLRANPKTGKALFTYTSYIQPDIIYNFDAVERKSDTFFVTKTDFDASNYTAQLKYYTSNDGTGIPIYLVHKKGVEKNGKNPVLLYGYGGFNITKLPSYSPYIHFWLEQGGIFASAHIRGGGEFGEEWHQAGTKENKQNVFDDFIAAGEYLINQEYTSSSKLAIHGASNGGLLVGAVINQRPELFGAAVPAVGVMDMLRYHKFTIGWAWASDYGTSEDSLQFQYLYKYSPLHNISESKKYPAVMVLTADHDDRVVPAHSFKYIATLQNNSKGREPKLIRIQNNAGHGANIPVSYKIEERSDMYTFIINELGVNFKHY